MADIPLTGLPSSFRTPIWPVEILTAAGPTITGTARRRMVIVMPILSSGTWTANILQQDVRSEAVVEAGAGAGSMAHRGFRMVQRVFPGAAVDIMPYAATSDGAPAKADLDITWETDPTAAGYTTVTVCGVQFRYDFTDSDSVTTIATAIRDKILATTYLPVTASNAAGVLTITAKMDGASQGDGTTGVIRVGCFISGGAGTTVTTENSNTFSALGLGAATAGADGTTTEAANLATALAAIKGRYEFTVVSAFDSTGVGNLRTHIASNELPKANRRGHGIFPFTGVRTTAATRAIAQNHGRVDCICQQRSWHDGAELAAWLAAVRQKNEELRPASAYDYYVDPLYQLLPAFDQSDWPDDDNLNDSISDGVTEIGSNNVTSYIGMLVSTKSKDSSGTYDEFKATEPHRTVIMDRFGDVLQERFRSDYRNAILIDDKLLPDGKVDMNRTFPEGTLTPYLARAPIVEELERFEERAYFQQVDEVMLPSLQVQRDPDNTGRIEVGMNCRTCDIAHQVTLRFPDVTPG